MHLFEILVVSSTIFSFGFANTVISVKENEKAVLVCPTDFKSDQRVRWSRSEGKSMPLNAYIQGLNLILSNVTKDCSGSYRCDAENGIITTYATQLTLEVHFRPEVTINSYRQEHHAGPSSGINEEIICLIVAFPNAHAKWVVNDQELYNNSNYYGFIVADVPSTDKYSTEVKLLIPAGVKFQGIIQCQGENTLGLAIAGVKVGFTDEDKQPAGLKDWQIGLIAVVIFLFVIGLMIYCCRSHIRTCCACANLC